MSKTDNNTNEHTKSKKKFAIKIGYLLEIIISIILIISATVMTIYIAANTRETASQYETEIANTNTTIINTIFDYIKEDIDNGNYNYSKIIIDKMKELGFIENVSIFDNDKIIYNYGVIKEKSKPTNILVQERDFGNLTVKMATKRRAYEEDTFVELNKKLAKVAAKIILVMILVAMAVGMSFSDIISNALERLSKAANEMANGNFNIRISDTAFKEINDLISSYNEMGGQLNELYNSLETKVQERTVALEEANSKLKETQAMMVHTEKMRSLGELVAGIAHEINNPVNFIHGNIMILQNYADDLIKIIDLYDSHSEKLTDAEKEEIKALKEEVDLEFLKTDIKDLIKSCIEGTQRTKNIVLDLKNFSRMEEMVLTQFDIPKEIDTTLNILNNKYKNRITVVKNYNEDVPKIEAYGGQLNQVFMNILDNAQDAIEGNGTVTINVKMADNDPSRVQIEFIDTGKGIEKENIKKVFEPFYTTKMVGKGTGLGMSISYRVIKDHDGTIDIDSEIGKGTKFTITLPIDHVKKDENK